MAKSDGLRSSNRVSISKSVHQLYKDLSERSIKNPTDAPFLLMKDVFMFAFALGVYTNKRRSLTGGKEQIFRWDQFSQDRDIPALKAVAVAETGDVEVLAHEDEILRIAEEYANAGIHELKLEVVDRPGQELWNLVNIIRECTMSHGQT
jgi:dnd system-associated protein 4